MRNIQDTMIIISTKNNHAKLNILEEIQIMRAAVSGDILNDVFIGKNESFFKLLPPVDGIQSVLRMLNWWTIFKPTFLKKITIE